MQWHLKPKPSEDFINKFPEYSPLVIQLLHQRGISSQEQIDEFFNPDYGSDLHDPYLMSGMKKAVERIIKAVDKKEKIIVYSDYDCDGVCGAVILTSFFRKVGADFEIYIPDREKEGYGLNKQALEYLKNKSANLIITVDCGITNLDEANLAKKYGIDVIITDHHQVPEKLPKACAVIDPHQKGDVYPFKYLSGAAVAFKLAVALSQRFNSISNSVGDIFHSGWEKWLLDLAALATVTDLMPLLGENRALVKYGLVVLAQTRRIGLRELMKKAGLVNHKIRITSFESNGENLTRHEVLGLDTSSLGFVLGPRLNAAGRMDHANLAYELLITESLEEAEKLTEKLDKKNRERQNLVDKIVKDIEARLGKISGEQMIIFEISDSWPTGVAGLAAGRLTEKYWRPSFVGCKINDRQSNFSIRSVRGLNIIEPLTHCAQFFEQFGGHKMAAGFRILNKNIEDAKKCLNDFIKTKISKENLIPSIDVDIEASLNDLNWGFYDQICLFAPFGMANPRPKILVKNIEIVGMDTVGQNKKHLRMKIKSPKDGKIIKAIGFNLGERISELEIGKKIDLVCELIADEWNGNRELQLKIIDLRLSEDNRHR